jgi:[acyl-carrier-protein] S-malonyltransferase
MGLEVAKHFATAKETLKEASEVLSLDIISLIKNGPEVILNRTDMTQPAILAVSVAIWRVIIQETNIKAEYMAGHSLGEYSALVCSGVMHFSDALKLVNLRGELMLKAVPEGKGGMSAVLGLGDTEILSICQQVAGDQVVSPVNYNAPGQVVIAGHKNAVERAGVLCLKEGAKKIIPLNVSGPFHSALMKPAAEELKVFLDAIAINSPAVPVINNVDVSTLSDSHAIKDSLIRQLYNPVRWTETIQWLEEQGTSDYVECGPGKVLAGLNKRINRRSVVHVTNDLTGFNKLLESLAS